MFRSNASTGTSLFAELKDVQGLLKLNDSNPNQVKPKSWTTSRTWQPEFPPREDFSKSLFSTEQI